MDAKNDETSRFLSAHLGERDTAWPRVRHREPGARPGPRSSGGEQADGPRDVLIVGSLVMEEWKKIDARKDDLAAALSGLGGRRKMPWEGTLGTPSVGGFVAHAARAAHALGCRPHLACAVPVPLPAAFEDFFGDIHADTRYVVAEPGLTPAYIHLWCRDGPVLIRRSGVQQKLAPRLPRDVLERFDAVLVDPAGQPGRSSLLRALHANGRPGDRRATVALCGRSDWDGGDLQAAARCGHWLFFNALEFIRTARRVAPGAEIDQHRHCPCALRQALGSCRLVAALGGCMKQRVGSCRLVASLGDCGAYLLGRDLPGTHIPTVPMSAGWSVGAGDVFAAVTALSSAGGADDEASVRRGVAAATGRVAGLPLPKTLEELDA